ncbi:UNVERIFIED_CONTAM: hypothetical protein Sindi_1883900 [Sesamum indicum]
MRGKNDTVDHSSTEDKVVDATPLNVELADPMEINSKSTPFTILPAVMINTIAMEEQLAQMAQAIAILQKIIIDKDLQIVQLMSNQEHTKIE